MVTIVWYIPMAKLEIVFTLTVIIVNTVVLAYSINTIGIFNIFLIKICIIYFFLKLLCVFFNINVQIYI